jgi:hypothetical protein
MSPAADSVAFPVPAVMVDDPEIPPVVAVSDTFVPLTVAPDPPIVCPLIVTFPAVAV